MTEDSSGVSADGSLRPMAMTGMSVDALSFLSENPEMPLFNAYPIGSSIRPVSDESPNTASIQEKPSLLRELPESQPIAHVNGLGEYARERIEIVSRLSIVLVTDAILFMVWLGTALAAQTFGTFVQARGVNEYFAMAFVWISSAATLCLTVLYIAADLVKEYDRLFGKNPPKPRKAK